MFNPVDNSSSFLTAYTQQTYARLSEAVKIYRRDFDEAFLGMTEGARRLNEVFGQNRQRVVELENTVRSAAPAISNLGGNILDTFSTLESISKGLGKNYAATEEDASKLYSASKLLGSNVEDIVEKFTEVGVQVSQIGPSIELAINSIQNLGLNTKQIFYEVQRNMDNLTKYNFTNGVDSLAKMAATASVFKFDMQETFRVAEKALTPDGAIELSSAFQRMGVAVGQLTDPFQLMNMSLNDPEGLQKSLSQMTKQYAEFDEKTKTFKINPAGMLQMRELALQTGIQYETLSKSALAAQNYDRFLSQMGASGIGMKDEDKMLLSNIARMDESGEYTLKIKNAEGVEESVKISSLNSEQLKEIVKQQKDAPKTTEEILKKQLDYNIDIAASAKSIKDAITYGATPQQVLNITENLKEFTRESASKVQQKFPKSKEISLATTGAVNSMVEAMSSLYKEYQSGTLTKESITKKLRELEESTIEKGKKIGEGAADVIKEIAGDFQKRFMVNNPFKSTRVMDEKTRKQYEQSFKTSTVEMGGTVTFKVDAPPGVSKNELENYINSREFKEKIYQYIRDMRKEFGKKDNF